METHRYIPEHAVPMPISALFNSTKERIEYGTADVVRVQVMGVIESVKFGDSDVEYMITDKDNHNILVQKILTASFTEESAKKFNVGDRVEVFGKVRILENGKKFLNAFSMHKASDEQFAAFQIICRFSEKFYKKHTPILPAGASTNVPTRFGLKNKVGSLNRFPMGMLEQSSSCENNMGVWPTEIEQLAAGISTSGLVKEESDVSEDSSDDSDEEDEEEEEEDDEEDSFDKGPVSLVPMARKEKPKEEPEPEYDSFENA
ncbi:Nucleic acid-binding, OB-fold protein [Caenorhabditis elegans]|uniref:Nucleic acid-binding, OB-fold protein n=1 Tax=Caenorhabditis elegans TaxID=6239 RepID=Q9TXQ8_CAEEL|nr:Nucleic acid-binding, OB-fold protein [Caenorhabditis elegans]CCD67319.1 Nucleic acid-binding, OB-fold protein [Caenorhabditis elegans]|eukprot:NP_491405.2 Uncharacterized protein CELE_D1007.8 [Caenorhabditis elegans]